MSEVVLKGAIVLAMLAVVACLVGYLVFGRNRPIDVKGEIIGGTAADARGIMDNDEPVVTIEGEPIGIERETKQ